MQPMKSQFVMICALALQITGAVLGGDLDPPAGPVAPTPGPNPGTVISAANTPGDGANTFIITQDGDYRLSGNINVPGGKTAIKIAANRVRIDLNGFTINGTAAPGANADGIVVSTNQPGGATVNVENGTITGFANGINVMTMPNNKASHFIAEKVKVTGNDNDGISSQHNSNRLFDVNANGNGANGVNAPNGGTRIAGGTFNQNGQNGVVSGNDTAIDSGARADGNQQDGFQTGDAQINGASASNNVNGDGFDTTAATKAAVKNVHATGNGANGVNASFGTGVQDSLAGGNGAAGIKGAGLTQGCRTPNNNRGVQGSGAAKVQGSTATGNKSIGFDLPDANSQLIDSVATDNGTGAVVGTGAVIENLTASGNEGNGLEATGTVSIQSGSFSNNGANGVEMQGGVIANAIANANGESGVETGEFAKIIGTSARGNADRGFKVGQFGHIENSTAESNAVGVEVAGATTVKGTKVANNTDGIQANGPATLDGNTIVNNAAGIVVFPAGGGTIITNCYLKFHPSGPAILLLGDKNLVIRSFFKENTTDVSDSGTDNKVAPIQCDPANAGPNDNWEL